MTGEMILPANAADALRQLAAGPSKHDRAEGIYTNWRNAHLGGLPTAVFNRLQLASEFLIAAIEEAL